MVDFSLNYQFRKQRFNPHGNDNFIFKINLSMSYEIPHPEGKNSGIPPFFEPPLMRVYSLKLIPITIPEM